MSGKESWKNPADFSIDDILAEAREIKKNYMERQGTDAASPAASDPVDEILAGVLSDTTAGQYAAAPREEEKTKERPVAEAPQSASNEKKEFFAPREVNYCFGVPDHTEVLPQVKEARQVKQPENGEERFPRRKHTFAAGRNIRPAAEEESAEMVRELEENRQARTHFIKTGAKGEEFSPVPPEMIEKPAMIRKQSKFDKTADLEAVPTIVPVDDSMTRAVDSRKAVETPKQAEAPAGRKTDDVEGQIRLTGFDEDESPAQKVDEFQVEKELHKARQEKIRQFRLFSQEEPSNEEAGEEDLDAPAFHEIGDYTCKEDAPAIILDLRNKRRMLGLRTAGTGLLAVLAAVLCVLQATGSSILDKFFGETVVYIGVMAGLAVAAILASLPAFLKGFKGIFTGRVNDDGAVAFAGFVALAHTVAMLWFPEKLDEGFGLYPVLFLLCLFLTYCGKCVLVQRMLRNFQFASGGHATHTVETIENRQDAEEIGRSLVVGDPQIQYNQKSKFARHFLEIADMEEPADVLASKVTYIAMGASLLLGAIVFAVKKDWFAAVTAFTAATCITVPAGSLLASNLPLLRAAENLDAHGAALNGFAGVSHSCDTGAVILEAAELFPEGSCCLHGIKTFGGMRVDEAILDTAAVIIGANGPLSDVFNKVIEGKREILPKAEDIVYEDRMGNSAWIYSRKILVGNRELMMQHGVEMPNREFELKYRHDGRKLLYLAIAGKVSAMFVVSYQMNEDVKERLARLERTGLTVLIRTSDPNIEEDMLTEGFELPEGFLRVITSHAGRIYDKYEPQLPQETDAYALTDGTANSLLELMDAAFHLKNSRQTGQLVLLIGVGLGFALTALLFLTGGAAYVKPIQLLLLQAVWTAVVLIVSRFRKSS